MVLTVENSAGPAPHGEGLGLCNVTATTRKHGGAARFEARGDRYYSRVLLRKTLPGRNGTENEREIEEVADGTDF